MRVCFLLYAWLLRGAGWLEQEARQRAAPRRTASAQVAGSSRSPEGFRLFYLVRGWKDAPQHGCLALRQLSCNALRSAPNASVQSDAAAPSLSLYQ